MFTNITDTHLLQTQNINLKVVLRLSQQDVERNIADKQPVNIRTDFQNTPLTEEPSTSQSLIITRINCIGTNIKMPAR